MAAATAPVERSGGRRWARRGVRWAATLLAGTALTACAASVRAPAPKVTQPPNLERPLVVPVHLYGGEPDADRIVARPIPEPPAPPPPPRWAIEPATPVVEDNLR